MPRREGVRTAPDAVRKVAQTDGAAAGVDSPFPASSAQGLEERGCRADRWRYPYTASSRVAGQKEADSGPVPREARLEAADMVGREGLVVGGKSLGGRTAGLVGDAGVEAFNEPNGGSPSGERRRATRCCRKGTATPSPG